MLLGVTTSSNLYSWLTWNYLFNKLNTSGKIHSEIDESPLDTLFFVFFLFEYEHVMVKELLQFFIGKVNTQLLITVVLDKTDIQINVSTPLPNQTGPC